MSDYLPTMIMSPKRAARSCGLEIGGPTHWTTKMELLDCSYQAVLEGNQNHQLHHTTLYFSMIFAWGCWGLASLGFQKNVKWEPTRNHCISFWSSWLMVPKLQLWFWSLGFPVDSASNALYWTRLASSCCCMPLTTCKTKNWCIYPLVN